jgi:hypothetical protein
MDKDFARKLVKDALQHSFEKERFIYLVKNLLNRIEETPKTVYRGNYIPHAYNDYISTLDRIGKYEDSEGKKLDILIVHLKKTTSLERARTMQRNFVAWYLNGSRGGVFKDAALAAFVAPGEDDWRFSFIKMEYKLTETLKGKLKAKEELTPARRYSFLVGENENSHTAQSRFVPLLVEDEHNPMLNELEDAFGIEKVTREFFEKYRQLFLNLKESLDKIVKKDKKIKTDFDAKNVDTVDFTKKLLGQIVFLYFLQKKGWFGVKRGQPWGKGSKHFLRELFTKRHSDYNNFFNDILEPLFYEALRLERPDDYYSRFDCRIPFLNGGLFDPINEYGWIDTDILIPDEIFSNDLVTKEGDKGTGILDVFDRYNFTVKEDEPLEKEVAVDPEMLGKVFENLLEVKDRKSKGTYYTPREIVHYMCQQSLINYLDTAINTTEKPMVPEKPVQEKFFGPKELQQKSLVTEQYDCLVSKEDIEVFVKYGDSRIENEIIARQKIENIKNGKQKTSTYKLSLPKSIHNNAKKIDEALKTIRVCDPAVGSGAFLVGMMHEIVNSRTVLSVYLGGENRTVYDFKRDAIQSCLYGVDIDVGAVEIAKLRLWLSLVVDEEERKTIKPLPNLDYKIVCGNSLLSVQRNLANWKNFEELESLKPLFFNETNPTKKHQIKDQIDEIIAKLTNGHTDFDFEIFFSEVFHEKKGFDIVIANPPYVFTRRADFSASFKKDIDRLYFSKLKKEKRSKANQSGKINLFALFILKGLFELRDNGFLCYIVPNNILRTTTYDTVRKYILDNTKITNIVDLGGGVFDKVTASTVVIALQDCKIESKRKHNDVEIIRDIHSLEQEQYNISCINQSQFESNISFAFNIFLDKEAFQLSCKINDNKDRLGTYCHEIIEGIVAHKQLIKTEPSAKTVPLVEGKSIKKYYISPPKKFLLWNKSKIHRTRPDYLWKTGKKIVIQRISGGSNPLTSALDTKKYKTFASVNNLLLKQEFNLYYQFILSLLNSRVLNWYYANNFSNYSELTVNISKTYLEQLPIPKLLEIDRKTISRVTEIVDSIQTVTQEEGYLNNPAKQTKVKELENQVDQMVYRLYGLNDEEIAIVEGRDKDAR